MEIGMDFDRVEISYITVAQYFGYVSIMNTKQHLTLWIDSHCTITWMDKGDRVQLDYPQNTQMVTY